MSSSKHDCVASPVDDVIAADYHNLPPQDQDPDPQATKPRVWVPSLLRSLMFASGDAIYRTSKQRSLGFDDLLELEHENATTTCFTRFSDYYQRHGKSLTRAMLLVYGKTFALCGLGQLFVAANAVFAPVVVDHVVSAFSAADAQLDLTNLSIWLSAFFLLRLLNVLVATQVEYAINHIALRVTAAMKSLLFRKALTRDASAVVQDHKSVEISNLVSSDTNGVLYAILATHNAWILPLQVLVITYLLYQQLDVAAFAGIGVVVASLALNYGIARVMGGAFGKLMEAKDARMKTIKEVFTAIQIVKFNAWEPRFHAKLTTQRQHEVQRLAVYSYASAASTFVLWSSPFFVSSVSFAVYALGMDRQLTAAKVFTSMALFNALRDPLRDLPTTIQSLIQSRVSIERLNSFLESPDLATSAMSQSELSIQAAPVVWVQNASFAWGETVVLSGINLTVQQGDLVVVHGSVGMGKSSLLSGILGEMATRQGSVLLHGRVAYYSQQPWIQNLTIRDNIMFGLPYDRVKYETVLDACCLRDDLALFDAGDATEIGERGVNLSGGQKARVALARACYADADVYLLDSPLAAVDSLVQKQIFDKCLCGFLARKTVVLVTHNPEIIASSTVNCRVSLVSGGRVCTSTMERMENATPRQPCMPLESKLDSTRATDAVDAQQQSATQLVAGLLVQDEARQQGQIAITVLRQYLDAMGGGRLLIVLLFAQLAWQGFQIGSDFWLSHWTSSGDGVTDSTRVAYFTNVYVALAAAGACMVLLRGVVVAVMGLRAATSLFAAMTDGLLHAPIRFFDANPIGRIINRYADDVATIDVLIPTAWSTLLSALFSTVGALLTAAVTIQYVGLFVVPIIYLYLRIAKGYVRTFCDVRRMLKVVNSPILSHITQSETGASILRAFGDDYLTRAIEENHKRIDVDNALWDTEIVMIQWFALRLQLLGCAIVLLVVGSFVAFSDWFSPGIVGLAFTYALSIDASLLTLMKAWSKAENAMVSVERVLEYSALPREGNVQCDTGNGNGDDDAAAMGLPLLSVEPPANWPPHGAVEFKNVCFAYKPGDTPVLRDVSVAIRAHEKIGIVGRTGAGKSSLSMALLRMNELASGWISIDGVDVASVPLPVLRSRIAIIPQSPVLLEGSLRHFLDPFDDYSDVEIVEMLAKVEMLTTLQAMAGTIESTATNRSVLALLLQANGENLSVGERQLLCMARALLRRCAIVVMDEATAAMDHATETKLARMVANELAHVTQLTIAHRLATVMDSDRILVLDQGRVVEFDAPATLLRDPNSAFSALVHAATDAAVAVPPVASAL